MLQRFQKHLTFANVVSMLALFMATSGIAWAATTLPKNSVGASQIKKDAVSRSEVKKSAVAADEIKNGSLGPEEFKPGTQLKGATGAQGAQGVQGPQGATGPEGPTGPAGTAVAFARVDENAGRTLQPNPAGLPAQVKGIVQANVVPGEAGAATGTTCFDLGFAPASAMVVVDNADAGTNVDKIASVAINRGEDLGDCPATHNDARVRIIDTDVTAGGADQDPGPANARFFVWFE